MSDLLTSHTSGIRNRLYLKRLSALLLFITVLFFFSVFIIRYPDSLQGNFLICNISGPFEYYIDGQQTVDSFFVENGNFVRKGEILYSTVSKFGYQDFENLEHLLHISRDSFYQGKTIPVNLFDTLSFINEAPEVFLSALKTINEYNFELSSKLRENEKKLDQERINSEIKKLKNLRNILSVLEEKVRLSSLSLARQKELFLSGAISKQEYENSEASFQDINLEKKRQEMNMQISENTIEELSLGTELSSRLYNDKIGKIRNSVKEKFSELFFVFNNLNDKYFIKAASDGYFFISNVPVIEEQSKRKVGIIVDKNYSNYGLLYFDGPNVGMIKIGQKSRIELSQYNSTDFGQLEASVENIVINNNGSATVLLRLDSGLMTNDGKKIAYNPFLSGTGELIINDKSLIEEILGW